MARRRGLTLPGFLLTLSVLVPAGLVLSAFALSALSFAAPAAFAADPDTAAPVASE